MLKQVLLNLKKRIPLHLKIEYPQFNVKEGLSIDTTFNPPHFSSNYTGYFKVHIRERKPMIYCFQSAWREKLPSLSV
jgi:hypothetical protein